MLNSTWHEFSIAFKNQYSEKLKIIDIPFIETLRLYFPANNVKIQTIKCWNFNIYEQDEFHALVSGA